MSLSFPRYFYVSVSPSLNIKAFCKKYHRGYLNPYSTWSLTQSLCPQSLWLNVPVSIFLSLFLSLCLYFTVSVSISPTLSLSLSFCLDLSGYRAVSFSSVFTPQFPSLYPSDSVYLAISLRLCIFVSLYVSLSLWVCLVVCVSLCLCPSANVILFLFFYLHS